MRAAVAVLLCGLVVACGGPLPGVAPEHAASYDEMAARPLRIFHGPGNGFCSVTPNSAQPGSAPRVGKWIQIGFGATSPQGNYAWNKTVWEFAGPGRTMFLLRGLQSDGMGQLYFGGAGINVPGVVGIMITDPQGGQVPFYPQIRLPADSTASFYMYPTAAGCYDIQVDNEFDDEFITFKAV